MLISLHRDHHAEFTLLWDTNYSAADNLARLRLWIVESWSTHRFDGWGCLCGWQYPHPDRTVWPFWFWRKYRWRQHVKVCPIPRDKYGVVVD